MAHKYKCYGQDCVKGSDCDDANSAVYPGSCSSAAVTWSACATSTTGGCNTGTCTRPLPAGCGDVCGDGKCESPETTTSCAADCQKCGNNALDSGETCDWGISSNGGWGNGVWAPKWVDCGVGYDQAYGQYTCKSDCSGLEYDYVCQSCGDGTCQASAETKASCSADCGKCGDGKVNGDEGCDWGSNKNATS